MKRISTISILCILICLSFCSNQAAGASDLETLFTSPPAEARPWVFWFWINGNVSREGVTADLEAMKETGIGGVVCMQVSGPEWAPEGPVRSDSDEHLEILKWAIAEADRLGIEFALAIDFGYGSGGPHITPDISMQQLYKSETKVTGGHEVKLKLPKPSVEQVEQQQKKQAWLQAGEQLDPEVTKAFEEIDSYRDIAVFAFPSDKEGAIPHLDTYTGLEWKTYFPPLDRSMPALSRDEVIDLTDRLGKDGILQWDAPKGNWTVVRLGYASNFKLTRPCPTPEVGLECDRLHKRGIEAHFDHRLRPVLEGIQGESSVEYIHIDSWEAHGQNWTKDFAREFKKRRGYDPRPWLPVLTGQVVESVEKTERFLWDLRQTVSDTILDNYIDPLRELITPYKVKFSCEPYGRLCIDSLTYGGRADLPIAEFWTPRKMPEKPGTPAFFDDYWYHSMKGLASVANTYGQSRVGAEAFTGCRGWGDHPYLLKAMGDEAFCEGISLYVFHLWAHQAYDYMKPGLTHRRWGQHINRHQTWWNFSKPYMTYVARCQTLLQQGHRVTDVACLYHEGAPLNFNDIRFELPAGYDYDLCSPEIINRMSVQDGHILLPSGARYRYLTIVPNRLTLQTTQKIESLRKEGARIYLQKPVLGTPGLEGYPNADEQVRQLTRTWPLLPKEGWKIIFAQDECWPDFEAENLHWIHRQTGDSDIYFVANPQYEDLERECVFRVKGRSPELWNPETGQRFKLNHERQTDGRIAATIKFAPAQSWFVVFGDHSTAAEENPFPDLNCVQEIKGPWHLSFDPQWGTDKSLTFEKLVSWTESDDPLVKYYSGTAVYRNSFELTCKPESPVYLDLGQVEVMAKLILNGSDCGIAWKSPYRFNITDMLRSGHNELEIHVVNTWVNRMIGDEQLPLDAKWKDWETLEEWPQWFLQEKKSPTGRYTFTTARHYDKNSPLQISGLLGPVTIREEQQTEKDK